MEISQVEIVDSHTGGEPTRVVISGGPDLGSGPLAERKKIFEDQFDDFRQALIREPRGNDVIVGALICEPYDSTCDVGVIFFNNVGYIGMCGHGTIGLVTTLFELGKIGIGGVKIDTPVGPVKAQLHEDQSVSVQNVPSYRYRADVTIDVPEVGSVTGDIAWGGNWFFLVKECPIPVHPQNIPQLREHTLAIRRYLDQQKISGEVIAGENDGHINHIEVFGPPESSEADSRNFVLCPGGEFDRSPCGTGTSAKVACLYSDGKLQPGERFCQESIIGSLFEATIAVAEDGKVIPTIRGRAHVHAISTLRMEKDDPFRMGIMI